MKLIGRGAESYIFSLTLLGTDAVAKVRKPKAYRIKELDLPLRKGRTKREARAMYLAWKAGVRVPRILGISTFSIYMERISGKLLKDCKVGNGLYQKTGEALGRMHKAGIAHGDFTPANIIVGNNEICVIDFGLSEITRSAEQMALDLLLMKRAISEAQYAAFLSSYGKAYPGHTEITKRLAAIEERGRYKIRTLE